ncbi:MAG: SusD/RagB family nutrient-binding outer membrane lipoprotein [Cyclobacteriaceae bacterium]|nr:SusD/RagB family nutrient-binding outer membrane lipoprotein [Cyclobacteriaceae bacterium]
MRVLRYIVIMTLLASFSSCEKWLNVNDNPNNLVSIPSGELLLKGTLLANAQINKGHALRSTMYYTGGLVGLRLVQQTIYIYDYSPGDSDPNWSHLYNGILIQNRDMRELSPNADGLMGVIDVNEALAVGTAASIWGDIPYSTAAPADAGLGVFPTYDSQADIFNSVQTLLDRGITTLSSASTSVGSADIYFNGDLDAWIESAHTLKARFYLLTKNYSSALSEVANGISSPSNTMAFHPIGTVITTPGNANTFYILENGSRSGDMTAAGSFFYDDLMLNRNNAKTDETARRNFLYINGDGASDNGIDAADADMPLVSYEENLLIWAECILRVNNDNQGAIDKLNELRGYLRSGNAFNVVNGGDTYQYDDYVLADFQPGGMENADNIAVDRAILREIIEERYVSGYTTYMPFDDMRRLRKSDSDVMVPIPFNTPSNTKPVERLLYPNAEIQNNPNTPNPIPDIFTPTPINQ